MRRLVVGDIHGGFKPLMQVLERANWNPSDCLLITLGDLCDGWPDTFEVVEFLSGLKNWKGVRGNHDQWLKNWMFKHQRPELWTRQGGNATAHSYWHHGGGVGAYGDKIKFPNSHREFLKNTPMYLNLDGKLFVHGGFDPKFKAELQGNEVLMWDRSLITHAHHDWQASRALHADMPTYGEYDEIYLGHTTLTNWGLTEPTRFGNIIGMDTGGGWEGKLSVMDIDTGEFWQSDKVTELYPGERGRNH